MSNKAKLIENVEDNNDNVDVKNNIKLKGDK